MRWLIVEDSLRDQKGHWFEYLRTLYEGLRVLGDEVNILADGEAEPSILQSLGATPVLPRSIWHRMGERSSAAARYCRVPAHALKTWQVMRNYLADETRVDVIFVPTMSVHHLLGWRLLLRRFLKKTRARLLLFFINVPIRIDPINAQPTWVVSPTTKLLRRLLQDFAPAIRSGRVILGAEPEPLQKALADLSGLPVVYFPQPVPDATRLQQRTCNKPEQLVMACYGAARSEKGSDILQSAVQQFLYRFKDTRSKFILQWIKDFENDCGKTVVKDAELLSNPNVEFITSYFRNGEYSRRLMGTNVLLLPYRRDSYALRGSRVALEGMVNGIPLVATRGTAFERQMEQFGAGVSCEDGNVDSLTKAIREIELRFEELGDRAKSRMLGAKSHFSVKQFRDTLISASEPTFATISN